MVIIVLVAAWALVEASMAIAAAAHPRARRRRFNLFSGRIDLST
jgi:hypothetical protein